MMVAAVVAYFGLRSWGMHYDRGVSKTVEVISGISTGTLQAQEAASAAPVSILHFLFVALKATGFYAVKLV
jgi:hypothetical protein